MIDEKKDSAAYLYGQVQWLGVGIETSRYRIRGRLVQHKDSRFSDSLNRQRDFIVLCDAKVMPLDNVGEARKYSALMVNRDEVILAWEDNSSPQ
jgi:hypothetical protein